MNYQTFQTSIHSTLAKSLEEDRNQTQKLDLLLEVYSEIKMNATDNQKAINNFIEWVSEISDCINSDNWNGEDVMGIFFNEFNRYKKKIVDFNYIKTKLNEILICLTFLKLVMEKASSQISYKEIYCFLNIIIKNSEEIINLSNRTKLKMYPCESTKIRSSANDFNKLGLNDIL